MGQGFCSSRMSSLVGCGDFYGEHILVIYQACVNRCAMPRDVRPGVGCISSFQAEHQAYAQKGNLGMHVCPDRVVQNAPSPPSPRCDPASWARETGLLHWYCIVYKYICVAQHRHPMGATGCARRFGWCRGRPEQLFESQDACLEDRCVCQCPLRCRCVCAHETVSYHGTVYRRVRASGTLLTLNSLVIASESHNRRYHSSGSGSALEWIDCSDDAQESCCLH